MKSEEYLKAILLFFIVLSMLIAATCNSNDSNKEKSKGKIFLYGETHGVERIFARLLEIWNEYYHNQNMRHLFIEFPYFTAEYLNM